MSLIVQNVKDRHQLTSLTQFNEKKNALDDKIQKKQAEILKLEREEQRAIKACEETDKFTILLRREIKYNKSRQTCIFSGFLKTIIKILKFLFPCCKLKQ